jgi:hypothetical protein
VDGEKWGKAVGSQAMSTNLAVDTLSMRGGIKGGGGFATVSGLSHSHPTSP